MRSPKRDVNPSNLGFRAFVVPVAWIVALVASYWLIADWQTLPGLVSNAIAAI
ncbi:MAG TPA: hypothetical protein VFN42_03595 [Acetobacteraceae bacterium]|nr:hypothetical protein [Acetobacteraceae bacterium]